MNLNELSHSMDTSHSHQGHGGAGPAGPSQLEHLDISNFHPLPLAKDLDLGLEGHNKDELLKT